ncbi:MAG: hypothetical protein WBB29_11815, partial [Geitlerinemataceae cyanobacterium]
MKLNRRSFNRTAIQLALGAAIGPIAFKKFRPTPTRSIETNSIAEAMTANINRIQDFLTPET